MNLNSNLFPEYLIDFDHPKFPIVLQNWLYGVMDELTDMSDTPLITYTESLAFELYIKPLYPDPTRKIAKMIRNSVIYLKRTRFNDILIGVPSTRISAKKLRDEIAHFLTKRREKSYEIHTLSSHSFTYLADNFAGTSSTNCLDEQIPNLHLIHISYLGPKLSINLEEE